MYMNYVAATGRGGWPMSVFLTTDLTPIYGGTYFPPQGFVTLLQRISQIWTTQRSEVVTKGEEIIEVPFLKFIC